MQATDNLTKARKAEYVLMYADDDQRVFVYWGENRHEVIERAGYGDEHTDGRWVWLQPGHFHETYQRLCDAHGLNRVYLMDDPELDR